MNHQSIIWKDFCWCKLLQRRWPKLSYLSSFLWFAAWVLRNYTTVVATKCYVYCFKQAQKFKCYLLILLLAYENKKTFDQSPFKCSSKLCSFKFFLLNLQNKIALDYMHLPPESWKTFLTFGIQNIHILFSFCCYTCYKRVWWILLWGGTTVSQFKIYLPNIYIFDDL